MDTTYRVANHGHAQWLSPRLPPKSVLSHLGFEPLGVLAGTEHVSGMCSSTLFGVPTKVMDPREPSAPR
jgi:hypothetical protein